MKILNEVGSKVVQFDHSHSVEIRQDKDGDFFYRHTIGNDWVWVPKSTKDDDFMWYTLFGLFNSEDEVVERSSLYGGHFYRLQTELYENLPNPDSLEKIREVGVPFPYFVIVNNKKNKNQKEVQ